MAFNCYLGIPGMGKTLLAVLEVYPILIQNSCEVYSNTWINFNGANLHYFADPMELVHLRGTKERPILIFWDEIGTTLDPRGWANMPSSLRVFFQQHRKRFINIIATTQNICLCEKSARVIAQYWAECVNYTPTEGIKGKIGIGAKLPFLIIRERALDNKTILEDKVQFIDKGLIDFFMTTKIIYKKDFYHRNYNKYKLDLSAGLYDTNREVALTIKPHKIQLITECEDCKKIKAYTGPLSDTELLLIKKLTDELNAIPVPLPKPKPLQLPLEIF